MVEQRFKLGTANAINEYGNFPILDNDKGLSLIEVINILNEYDAVFKSIDRLTDEGGGAIEYDTPNAAYYVFYHRVSGFKRCIPPNVILGTIKGLHKKIDEQQSTIEAKDKEIEESKITIQLYESDVSMRDNFLKSKGLYDEFLQCNMGGE